MNISKSLDGLADHWRHLNRFLNRICEFGISFRPWDNTEDVSLDGLPPFIFTLFFGGLLCLILIIPRIVVGIRRKMS